MSEEGAILAALLNGVARGFIDPRYAAERIKAITDRVTDPKEPVCPPPPNPENSS